MDTQHLSAKPEDKVGREVDVAIVERVRRTNPPLLATILREGRVIIDRDRSWKSLLSERDAIEREAVVSRERLSQAAAAAIARILGEAT